MPEGALLVDARAPFGSGLGRYMRELVRALAQRQDFREIVLAGDPDALAPFQHTLPQPLRVITLGERRYSWRVPMRWQDVSRQVGMPHVSWFPHWDGAWNVPPTVTTVHDLIAFDGTGPKGLARREIARRWIAQMIEGSTAIITGAEGAAQRLREAYPEVAAKLRVIPHGVADVFFATQVRGRDVRLAQIRRAALGHDAPYLLTVANKKPHKRLETAITAFAAIAAEDPALRLVMVGERLDHAETLRGLAASLGVAERVDDLTGLTDEALAATYAGAEALLVTSREEGFGMVALEAMACGAPVIAVDRAPLPEVVGDAGLLVPFDDASALADAVRRLRGEASLRAQLVGAGFSRAAGFTWTRAASATAAVLREGLR